MIFKVADKLSVYAKMLSSPPREIAGDMIDPERVLFETSPTTAIMITT